MAAEHLSLLWWDIHGILASMNLARLGIAWLGTCRSQSLAAAAGA